MSRKPHPPSWLMAAVALWVSCQTVAAYSIPFDNFVLAERADDNCASGFDLCPQAASANLPDNFCCPSGSTCQVLAGNTTILCCPAGKNCNEIGRITCDIDQQNADKFPSSSIKTTALNSALTECGSKTSCCPFGYSCQGQDKCKVNANQNAAPIGTTPSKSASSSVSSTKTSSSSSSSSTSSSSSSSSATSSPATTTTAASESGAATVIPITSSSAAASAPTDGSSPPDKEEDSGSKGPATASVVGGVIGALAGVALAGAALWFLWARRKQQQSNGGGFGSHRRNGSSGTGGTGGGGHGGGGGMFYNNEKGLQRSTSSFGNIIKNPLSISSPKPQGEAYFRTDFIRKLPSTPSEGRRSRQSRHSRHSRPITPVRSSGGSSIDDRPSLSPLSAISALAIPTTAGASATTATGTTTGVAHPPPPAVIRPQPPYPVRDSFSIMPIRAMRPSSTLGPAGVGSVTRPYGGSSNNNTATTGAALGHGRGREPSLEEINVGADPSIIGHGLTTDHPASLVPGGAQRYSQHRMTTFSSMMEAAQLDPSRPYVPGSIQSSPASRRR